VVDIDRFLYHKSWLWWYRNETEKEGTEDRNERIAY